jgi:hypothetical protein
MQNLSLPEISTVTLEIGFCAGIFKQSMGARNRVGIGLSDRPARARIFKRLWSPGIDSRIKSAVVRRAGTITRFLLGS